MKYSIVTGTQMGCFSGNFGRPQSMATKMAPKINFFRQGYNAENLFSVAMFTVSRRGLHHYVQGGTDYIKELDSQYTRETEYADVNLK